MKQELTSAAINLKSGMPSLTTYEVLDVTLPAVLIVVIFIATFLVALLGILCKRYCIGKKDKPVPLVLLEMVDLAFPDLEKKKDDYEVFDRPINRWCFVLLTILIAPVITSTCFITFWNVYAVEESGGGACVENFDCFPRMGGEYLQREPVDNCSSFSFTPASLNESNSTSLPLELDITYNCFRLVFRYAEGFGAAGGILALTALFSKVYFSILVSIKRYVGDDSDDRMCRFLLYTPVWLMCAGIFVIFLGINLGIPAVRDTVFQTITDTIQFVMYAITLVLITITGVIVAIGME